MEMKNKSKFLTIPTITIIVAVAAIFIIATIASCENRKANDRIERLEQEIEELEVLRRQKEIETAKLKGEVRILEDVIKEKDGYVYKLNTDITALSEKLKELTAIPFPDVDDIIPDFPIPPPTDTAISTGFGDLENLENLENLEDLENFMTGVERLKSEYRRCVATVDAQQAMINKQGEVIAVLNEKVRLVDLEVGKYKGMVTSVEEENKALEMQIERYKKIVEEMEKGMNANVKGRWYSRLVPSVGAGVAFTCGTNGCTAGPSVGIFWRF